MLHIAYIRFVEEDKLRGEKVTRIISKFTLVIKDEVS